MLKQKGFSSFIEINIALIFISTSGALGRFIDMPVPITIASRAIIAGVLLFAFCKWKKIHLKVRKKDAFVIVLGGIFMGLHWITYFYALKLSNVAIGMLSLFTYPIITALLEPIFLKTRFQKMHLALASLGLIGIYFLVPEFDIENNFTKAVGFGLFSALCYSLRNIIMKSKINNYHGSALMFYQLLVISAILSPLFLVLETSHFVNQLPATLMLAFVTTAIGHTLFLLSFKSFSITTASIISSIQPVYGIIIGIIFLKEYPELTTIFGGLLIIISVIVESLRAYNK